MGKKICAWCKKEIKKKELKFCVIPYDEHLENIYHRECYLKKIENEKNKRR